METKNELEGFPREVIEKMLERQVEQGNPRNEELFKRDKSSLKTIGGFAWNKTIEGESFWHSVIENKNFSVFFKKYPKESELDKWLRETKAKNLGLLDLNTHIMSHATTPIWIYNSLKEKLNANDTHTITKILYDQWNAEPEAEWHPKRGEKVLVWDTNEKRAEERLFYYDLGNVEYPIMVVDKDFELKFYENQKIQLVAFQFMKPIPKEEPKAEPNFKDKVVGLIEEEIESSKLIVTTSWKDGDFKNAIEFSMKRDFAEYLLKQIKEL